MDSLARILVVDDDGELREQIVAYLMSQGLWTCGAGSAADMDCLLEQYLFDVVVLDVILPDENGLSICQRLKAQPGPYVLILSGAGETVDRIVGLELGADDYLAKPCSPRELLARIRGLLRNKQQFLGLRDSPTRYAFSGFRLNVCDGRLATTSGATLSLTSGELALLVAFLERPNRVLTRSELMDAAWGTNIHVFDRAIDVQLSRLRRKLREPSAKESMIETCRNAGYRFRPTVHRL